MKSAMLERLLLNLADSDVLDHCNQKARLAVLVAHH